MNFSDPEIEELYLVVRKPCCGFLSVIGNGRQSSSWGSYP